MKNFTPQEYVLIVKLSPVNIADNCYHLKHYIPYISARNFNARKLIECVSHAGLKNERLKK